MILFLIACGGGAELAPHTDNPFHADSPSIQSVSGTCNPEDGEWLFEMSTSNWTGGGWVWIGKSETNVESHRIRSIKAAADGSSDALELRLDIEPDWRDATRNKSTRYLCADQPELSFMMTAYGPHGEQVQDCRTWGVHPELWMTIDAAHDCTTIVETETDTGSN